MPRQRIGFYVEVEVDARPTEAVKVIEEVLGWPGDHSIDRDGKQITVNVARFVPVTRMVEQD